MTEPEKATTLQWKEPPPDGRHTAKQTSPKLSVLAELRLHPGDWALISTETYHSAITHWKRVAGDGFEFVTRMAKSGGPRKIDLYGRYVG